MNNPFPDDIPEGDAPKEPPKPVQELEKLRDSLLLIKPTVPFQWKSQPRDAWVFPDFKEEFLRSPHLFSEKGLIHRWAGIAKPEDIQTYFAASRRTEERNAVQFEQFQKLPPRTTAEIIAWANYKEREIITRQIDELDMELTSKETPETKMLFDDNGRPIHRTIMRDLTPNEIDRKRARVESQSKARRLLDGEATEIFKVEHSTEELDMERMIAEEMRKNPRFALLDSISRGELHEGEVVETPQLPEHKEFVQNEPNTHS